MKYLIIFSSLLFVFSSCRDRERKIVNSDYGDYSLTILKIDNEIYLINREYKSDNKPQNDFILNNGGVEYYTGLINWSENSTNIYTTYGVYDTTKADKRLKLTRVSTSEFEKLKKDSSNYKYFYY